MESQPQDPKFRNNPENFSPCVSMIKIQEVFHVYLNKFEIALSHLFHIKFSNNKFTLVNLISRNTQSPRK